MRIIRENVSALVEGCASLSHLGRVQLALILLNTVLTAILLNVGASREGRRFDLITFTVAIEFGLFTLYLLAYTIMVESVYAFAALMLVQLELAAFTTGAAVTGVLTQLYVKWIAVSVNWFSLLSFVVLLVFVRRTWGWHAYKTIGVNPEHAQLYDRYCMAAAALTIDVMHSVFFITSEEVIVHNHTPTQYGLVYGAAVPAIVLGPLLLWAIRHEFRFTAAIVYCWYVAGFGVYIYFVTVNTVETITRDDRNLSPQRTFSTENQSILVVSGEWVMLAVRFVTLVALLVAIGSQGLRGMFAMRGNAESRYLINVEQQLHRERTPSAVSNRHVHIIDATHRLQSALDLRQP